MAGRSAADAAADHFLRRRAARRRGQQRDRRRHHRARRRGERPAACRLRRQGCPRQARPVRCDAVGLSSARRRRTRRGRPGQLQLEPGERLVARRRRPDPLGTP